MVSKLGKWRPAPKYSEIDGNTGMDLELAKLRAAGEKTRRLADRETGLTQAERRAELAAPVIRTRDEFLDALVVDERSIILNESDGPYIFKGLSPDRKSILILSDGTKDIIPFEIERFKIKATINGVEYILDHGYFSKSK